MWYTPTSRYATMWYTRRFVCLFVSLWFNELWINESMPYPVWKFCGTGVRNLCISNAATLVPISSVVSSICQEGQSARTFPIFAFSSRFILIFSLFFPIFGKFFAVKGALCLLDPPPSGNPTGSHVFRISALLHVYCLSSRWSFGMHGTMIHTHFFNSRVHNWVHFAHRL